MIDCVRSGHNRQSPGGSAVNVGGLDETTEAILVCASTIKYLKQAGDTVIDGTPGPCDTNTDLRLGTDTANRAKADIFVPEHFNKAYNSYNGAIGSEIWINPKNPEAVIIGTRILNNLAALGFKNRGLKDGYELKHLHDVRAFNGTTVLVEVCFCEATEDIRIYRKVGPDAVGKAIADGIAGYSITKSVPKQTSPVVTVPQTRVNNSIAQLQAILNRQGANLVVDGFYGPKTLSACPTVRAGAEGEITKWLQKRLAMTLQDGIFGTGTRIAVLNYQKAMGLSQDAVIGKGTWDAMLS